MEEDRTIIFNNSTHVIGRLQLLSAFFEDEIIYKIYLKSQVIHSIFENNPELDVHKLELFHLQYTESVIELLKKIKKNNEKSVSILYDEIEANNDLIAQINNNALTEQQFEADRQGQAQKISISINNLYQNLADLSTDYPFPKTIHKFSIRYAEDFYTEIPVSVLETITTYDFEGIYKNGYAGIDKKLLGLQCKYEFKNGFICGLKAGKEVVEARK
jgi:hypothetical protein